MGQETENRPFDFAQGKLRTEDGGRKGGDRGRRTENRPFDFAQGKLRTGERRRETEGQKSRGE
jgi:hypothetical protein